MPSQGEPRLICSGVLYIATISRQYLVSVMYEALETSRVLRTLSCVVHLSVHMCTALHADIHSTCSVHSQHSLSVNRCMLMVVMVLIIEQSPIIVHARFTPFSLHVSLQTSIIGSIQLIHTALPKTCHTVCSIRSTSIYTTHT